MTTHTCPPCCHICPDMDDTVMPGCMGTAALALEDTSFAWCTCEAKLPADASPQAQISLLTTRVAELEARLARLEAGETT